MSVRLSVLAAAALCLSACDASVLQPQSRQAACCCAQCPMPAQTPAATPAGPAKPTRTAETDGGGERAVVTRTTYRGRPAGRVRGTASYYRYESSEEGLAGARYGGRYGAHGRGGVVVSVEETETASSSYSYSESSSGYAYGSTSGGYAYGSASGGAYGYGPGGARVSSDPPHHPGYRLAGVDQNGYLTWPGKVED
jgi:hypothetical protein